MVKVFMIICTKRIGFFTLVFLVVTVIQLPTRRADQNCLIETVLFSITGITG